MASLSVIRKDNRFMDLLRSGIDFVSFLPPE